MITVSNRVPGEGHMISRKHQKLEHKGQSNTLDKELPFLF